jgi:hypothetical protein
LLRFVLDAHPDLACPPETNLPALCGQLATVWSLIVGAPLSVKRGDEPPVIPDAAAIAGVRESMDRITESYLARRGRKRYVDKSLDTARFTDLPLQVYGSEIHLPVPASDGCDRIRAGGMPVGPERVRIFRWMCMFWSSSRCIIITAY